MLSLDKPFVEGNPRKRKAGKADIAYIVHPIPDTKRPKVSPRDSRPTVSKRFCTNRPVQVDIPLDVWRHILTYCSLSFLLKVKDTSRDFHEVLGREAIWKRTRYNNYGPDHPDPPTGLTESQYADLLVGVGCQNKGCNDTKARKTYWAFQRRWCDSCMRKNVIIDYKSFEDSYPGFGDCISQAKFDSWGNYQCVGQYPEPPSWIKAGDCVKTGYLRSDLAKIAREMDEFKHSGSEEDSTARQIWLEAKTMANNEYIRMLQSIEDWVEMSKKGGRDHSKHCKEKRIKFISERALLMEPALALDALQLIPSYKNAIDIRTEPTENMWSILRPKLQKERERAEAVLKERKQSAEESAARQNEYMRIKDLRTANDTLPQLFVQNIADDVIADLTSANRFVIPDEEFVRIALRTTYERYQATPETSKPQADSGGKYRLLMDDARMIYRYKIRPVVESWNNEKREKKATEFKCLGCRERKIPVRHNFENLLGHIFSRHAEEVGEFDYFHVYSCELPDSTNFPWYRIEWPSNLPIPAEHQDLKRKWNAHAEMEDLYTPLAHQDPEHRDLPPSAGAFDARVPSLEIGAEPSDFVGNVLFVASMLRDTPLEDAMKTQVAFQYALQKFQVENRCIPKPEVLAELQLALVRKGVKGLFEGFRCQTCCDRAATEPQWSHRLVRYGKSFGELIEHFRSEHDRRTWTTAMLALPTASALRTALKRPGNKKAASIFEGLFPREADLNLDPALR